MINTGIQSKQISGFKVCRGAPLITHSFYADDSLIFLEANLQNVNGIKSILNCFSDWSGQLVSGSKSTVIFSDNMPKKLAKNLCRGLQMKLSQKPGSYLGVNMQWGRIKGDDFKDALIKLTDKLSGWKHKALNFAGRDVLVKAVLYPSLNHLMSTLKIPKYVLNKVDKLRRDFLWQNKDGSQKLHAIAFDNICCPVWCGGLGVRYLEFHNFAFLANTTWRIASNQESLVASLFRAKYHRDYSFWDAKYPNRASWCWRSIFKGKELVKSSLKWRIGSGESVNLWHEKWCYDQSLAEMVNYKDGGTNGIGGARCARVIRRSDGGYVAAFNRYIFKNTNNMAELWVVKDGLQLAADLV